MLKDKIIVITGGGGILCSAFAEELAKEGAKIAVLDLNLAAAQKVADKIISNGGIAIAESCNVLLRESLEATRLNIINKLGKCDILINGAGGNNPKGNTTKEIFQPSDIGEAGVSTFFDLKAENVNFVFNLNFTGTLLPTQVFAEDMVNRDGVILNMSSMSAYNPLTKVPVYSAAKAAISNFTMWLAVHFAPVGIRVNAMAPGFFDTNQNHSLLFNEDGTPTERTAKIIAHTPMRRMGTTEDLLGTLKFLLDNEQSAFITGTIIPIDGGFSAYSGV